MIAEIYFNSVLNGQYCMCYFYKEKESVVTIYFFIIIYKVVTILSALRVRQIITPLGVYKFCS